MKKLFFAGMVVALAGCVQVDRYEDVVKAPAPAGLAGFWQTKGPQSAMMSPDAIASLIVTKEGDTFDCRQWQRVMYSQDTAPADVLKAVKKLAENGNLPCADGGDNEITLQFRRRRARHDNCRLGRCNNLCCLLRVTLAAAPP